MQDMKELSKLSHQNHLMTEQVQDFTPTPMTISTETYYTGFHPYTLKPVYCAKTPMEKQAQRLFFFWYDRKNRAAITAALKRIHRIDLLRKLY